MSTDVKVNYINDSEDKDHPQVFIFAKNELSTSKAVEQGIAWRVLEDIGQGSSSCFTYPIKTSVRALWGGCNKTKTIESEIGKRYSVVLDDTGIVLKPDGEASDLTAIEIVNNINVVDGIQAQISKDGRPLMLKEIVAYGDKATFVLHPKLYWGLASEITEGQTVNSTITNAGKSTPQSLEGVSEVNVILRGNAKDGYKFHFEKIK